MPRSLGLALLLISTWASPAGAQARDPLSAVPQRLHAVVRFELPRALEVFEAEAAVKQRLAPLGLDPRDLEELTLALDLEAAQRLSGEGALLLLRGKLDAELVQFLGFVLAGSERAWGQRRYLLVPRFPEVEVPVAIALLEPGLLALGSEALVREALATFAGEAPSLLLDPSFTREAAQVGGGLGWCVLRVAPDAAPAVRSFGVRTLRARLSEEAGVLRVQQTSTYPDYATSELAIAQAAELWLAAQGHLAGRGLRVPASVRPGLLGSQVERDDTSIRLELELDLARWLGSR
ncbi:MAG: hypothetical protein R3F62_24175 [Planctomycetota bacterium]